MPQQKKNISFPSPFEIAIGLTVISIIWASFATLDTGEKVLGRTWEVLGFWKDGFWGLLEFTMQMVLILVLGHAIAISKPVNRMLNKIANLAKTNTQAVMITGISTMVAGFLNWGFGLILGAILARKIGEEAHANRKPVNYSLVAASGYLGMLIWHGGFSGSAPLKVAEPQHFLMDKIGIIPIEATLLSGFNLKINLILFLAIGVTLFALSKVHFKTNFPPELSKKNKKVFQKSSSGFSGIIVGGIMVVLALSEIWFQTGQGLGFVHLNYINFLLFGLALVFHINLSSFVKAIKNAIAGASGIILQFPFYAAILGVLKESGLLVLVADFFVKISSPVSFPLYALFSAGLINLFVPSGGGQWAVQGPVIIEAAQKMNLSIPQMIMIMAYGDQLTNMLQPFWALPLLAITGVAPKELLKYTFYFFMVGGIVLGIGVYLAF
ncbi:TIGR00366 family protein [Echinicola jeungdonensis]|uniref:TIGR00366 family protein n=1 Tax=Echinicola jeungdonensis TaxID=709343 RepID=A0ABV5J8Q8_9BACT|nr:TIGR00366 family protein [Echinicola jeungdonensis]MDN3670277.1 TIGR00366 family protein [Echinicola jeungdonensis]